jgi:DNA-binding response OmpR family regulator
MDLETENAGAAMRVMIVEDEPLIAMDLAAILRGYGAAILGPCLSVAEALAMLDTDAPDAALVDIRLGDGVSFAIAAELARRGVSFAFVTAVGNGLELPEELQTAPFICKPFDPEEISAFLRLVYGRNAPDGGSRDQASLG